MNELTSRVERLRSALSGPAPGDERFEGLTTDRLLERMVRTVEALLEAG
ncbi:hypothetical protein ACIHCV_01315 [Streptomyces sp. NPDC051956]